MDMGEAAMACMAGYIAGCDLRKRFVKSNIFWVRFSWAPSEYCVSVTDAMQNLPVHVPLFCELTYRTS